MTTKSITALSADDLVQIETQLRQDQPTSLKIGTVEVRLEVSAIDGQPVNRELLDARQRIRDLEGADRLRPEQVDELAREIVSNGGMDSAELFRRLDELLDNAAEEHAPDSTPPEHASASTPPELLGLIAGQEVRFVEHRPRFLRLSARSARTLEFDLTPGDSLANARWSNGEQQVLSNSELLYERITDHPLFGALRRDSSVMLTQEGKVLLWVPQEPRPVPESSLRTLTEIFEHVLAAYTPAGWTAINRLCRATSTVDYLLTSDCVTETGTAVKIQMKCTVQPGAKTFTCSAIEVVHE